MRQVAGTHDRRVCQEESRPFADECTVSATTSSPILRLALPIWAADLGSLLMRPNPIVLIWRDARRLGTLLPCFHESYLSLFASTNAFSQPKASGSADQIRLVRREIDTFFQRHDPKKSASLFTSDCHFTAPSVHIDGLEALERSHTLIHNSNRIVVNEEWNFASEQGEEIG